LSEVEKDETTEEEEAELYVYDSSGLIPESQTRDFCIAYSWQPVFVEPTHNEVRPHIREANR
jgi:hypothetical protein